MQYIKGATWHWLPDMTDDVIVYKSTGDMDAYGKRTLSTTGTTYAAHIMSNEVKLTTDQKRTTLEEGTLIIMDNPDVNLGDRIQLPNGNIPVITKIDKMNYTVNDVTVPHHIKITFGRSH